MSGDLKLFDNPQLGQVRIVMRNDEPWFVAKDVAQCIEHKDVSSMCKLCRDKDKLVSSASDFDSANLAESGNARITLISESGLYRILAKCNLPKCERFESWVFDEVLPSIRKTGKYETQKSMPKSFAEALRAYANEVEARENAQKALIAEQEQHRKDNEDFCNGLDILNQKKAEISTRQLATAMNTASQKSKECTRLTKENEQLKDEVGRGKEWQTASDMSREWINMFGHKPDGKKLTNLSLAMGLPCPKDVLRTFEMGNTGRYREDHVRRYRKEVWEKYREIEEEKLR